MTTAVRYGPGVVWCGPVFPGPVTSHTQVRVSVSKKIQQDPAGVGSGRCGAVPQ